MMVQPVHCCMASPSSEIIEEEKTRKIYRACVVDISSRGIKIKQTRTGAESSNMHSTSYHHIFRATHEREKIAALKVATMFCYSA